MNTQCAPGVQVLDVAALGVQGVRGDHHSGQVEAGQRVAQRRESVNLTGLRRHGELPEYDPGVVVDHRQQVPARLLGITAALPRCGAVAVGLCAASGTAQGLAVHREHPASSGRAAHSCCTNVPITASNRSASTRPSSRRVVGSDGQRVQTPHGSPA
jgi:hypothetical protein